MDRLKDELVFSLNKIVYTGIKKDGLFEVDFGKAKSYVTVEIGNFGIHKGKILSKDNKRLAWLKGDNFKGEKPKRNSKNLIKRFNLQEVCVICGETNDKLLQAHHVKEHSKGGLDEPKNLVVVCNICHTMIHSIRSLINRSKH